MYIEDADYTPVYNAMTVKPSQSDRDKQNTLVKAIKNSGAWTKAIVLDVLAAHNEQASLLNWKSPGTFNPSKQASPEYIANKGFRAIPASTAYVKSNFIPSINGAGFLGQNDMTFIVAVNEELDENKYVFGAQGTNGIAVFPRYNNFTGLVALNAGVVTTPVSRTSKRYYAVSRNSATQIEVYRNLSKQITASTSEGLCSTTLTIGGIASWGLSARAMSFVGIFKYLTESEVRGVVEAVDSYLAKFGNQIRNFPTSTYFNLVTEGHSFFTSTDILSDTISAMCNSISLTNFAVGGNTTTDLVARAATVDAKLVTETSSLKNIMCLWIGVNSVTETAGTGASAYSAMKSYIQARTAAGWKVFCFTMTKATGYPDRGTQFEIERNIFNNSMRNDLALLANVYILDTDTVPEIQNPADTTYYTNTLHPNSLGLALAANLFKTKIAEVYP